MWRTLGVLILAGCGRFGFEPPNATGDAGPIDVNEPTGFCATATFADPAASSLHDDFTVDPLTALWSPINPTMPCIAQTGGELVASPTANPVFCHAYTNATYHLTCDSIFVRVPQVTRQDMLGVQTFIYVYRPDLNKSVQLLLEQGGFQLDVAATATTYNTQTDAWWRVSERDGDVMLDTSADGTTWVEQLRTPTPFALDSVQIALGAGTYQQTPSPGQARFRCYNVPPPCN